MCGIQMAGDHGRKAIRAISCDVIETMVKNFHEHDLTCNFVALERDPMQTTNAYGPFGSFWIFGPYGRLQGRSLGRNWISMPIGGQLPSEWHNASAIFYSFGSLADTCRLIVSCCVSVHHTPSVITFSTFSGWVFVWKSICRTLYTAICHSPHAKRDVGCESLLWVSCPGSETAERNSSFLVQHGDRLQRRALACFAPLSSSLTQDSMTNHCLNSYPQRPTWTFLLVEHTRRVSYQIRREMGCEHLAA